MNDRPSLIREDYPFGGRYRCPTCGCHVKRDHVPGSRDCHEAQAERDASRRD